MTAMELKLMLSTLPDHTSILARVDGSIYPIDTLETADYNADADAALGEFFLYVDVD